MKKKIICLCIIFAITLSVVIIALVIFHGKNAMNTATESEATPTSIKVSVEDYTITYENNATLYIEGNDVSRQTYIKKDEGNNRFVVSLMYITQSLGLDVYKVNEYNYTIINGDDCYKLNTADNIMRVNSNPMNIIGDPNPIINPNSESANSHVPPYYERTKNDYLIDSNTIEHFLYLLDYQMEIDYKSATVTINKADNPQVKLLVNEKEQPIDKNIRINYKEAYAEIPLISVLTECGVEVKEIDEGKYSIKKDENNYILDTRNNVLTQNNLNTLRWRLTNIFREHKINTNLFKMLVGGKVWHYYKATDDDYYISTDVASPFLRDLGFRTEIDYENYTVSIYKLENDN